MRDAPSLDIVPALQKAGAHVVAFDPEGMAEAAKLLPGVAFAKTAYEAAKDADVLVVITEWHEFRGLDPRRIKEAMRNPRIVDLRNIFDPDEMRGLGFTYEGVGRPQPPI
jgi:UDPglucose 6-dehydrogenase